MKKNALFSLLALVVLWAVWIVAYYIVRNDFLLPSFWETMKETGKLLGEGAFWRAFFNTFLRTLRAFLFSFATGVALAVAGAFCGGVRAFLAPVISVLRTVPTMAVILVLLLWTSPAAAPVVVASLVLMPAVYSAALASLVEVKAEYGELARAFGVGAGRKIFKMYLPLAAPPVLAQSGPVFSMGLKITVSGEVLSATYRSLGGMMQEAQMYLEMPRLLALTLVAVLLGFFLEGIFWAIGKRSARWRAWN